MSILGLQKKVDKKYVTYATAKYCELRESKKYPEEVVTTSAINALKMMYYKDERLAGGILRALKDKYPKTKFPDSLG